MRPRRRALALLALAAILVGVAAPATAADDVLVVSLDGVTFTRTLAEPVFPAGLRMVPGDLVSEDLWVRNTGSTPARLRVELVGATSTDRDLARALSLGVITADGRGTPTPTAVEDAGECTVVISGVRLDAGESLRLRARAVLGDLEGQLGQDGVVSFGYRLVVTDTAAPRPADRLACAEADGDDDVVVPGTPGSKLASTGAEGVAPLGLLAAGLIGAGVALVLAFARRSSRDHATA